MYELRYVSNIMGYYEFCRFALPIVKTQWKYRRTFFYLFKFYNHYI